MRLLLITQYFPPEVGAPQNRLYELMIRLAQKNIDVTILTAMPNYPAMEIHEQYKGSFYKHESVNNLEIHRTWIYVSKQKNIFARLMNYFSFVFSSIFVCFKIKGNYDFVMIESPPLFLGISGLFYKWLKNAKLIFNVSDLWPESAEKLGVVTNKTLLGFATKLEEYCYKKASIVSGQTQGIVSDIKNRIPNKTIFWLKNGIDDQLLTQTEFKNIRNEWSLDDSHFIITYAGIVGIAQGLEIIIHVAESLKEKKDIQFLIVGEGPVKSSLQEKAKELNLKNIHFLPLQSKENMKQIVWNSDLSLVPLKKLDLFKGAIPSKIFEWLLAQKPILLGVDGEAKTLFIDTAQAGLFFEPENIAELKNQILIAYENPSLTKTLGENGKKYVLEHFNRNIIAEDFKNLLEEEFKKP